MAEDGFLNGINYHNQEANRSVNLGLEEMNEQKRLQYFQEVMKIITQDDPLGVPLFTSGDKIVIVDDLNYEIHLSPSGIIYF